MTEYVYLGRSASRGIGFGKGVDSINLGVINGSPVSLSGAILLILMISMTLLGNMVIVDGCTLAPIRINAKIKY